MQSNKKQQTCTQCPIALVADLLGDIWTILIVRDLVPGPKRFNTLLASLSGVSTRTLSNKLKKLESSGIVDKKSYNEKPPRVLYSLTQKGIELNSVLKAMKRYGEKNL
jgi:DNA-binding HxlR family transcriptional regulator